MAGVRLDMAPDEARNEKEKARGSESTLGHDWRELSAAQCPTSTHPSVREKRNIQGLKEIWIATNSGNNHQSIMKRRGKGEKES